MAEKSEPSATEHGITRADMEQIEKYLQMPQYERTPDDLRE